MATGAVTAARLLPQFPRLQESNVHRLKIGRRLLSSCQNIAAQQASISVSEQLKSNSYADFASWLTSRSDGGDLSPVRIELGSDGRALFTTRPVAVGERLMEITPGMMLTQRDLPQELDKILHSSVKEMTKVALVILVERQKGQASSWAPYISFLPLPGDIQSTIFWKGEELRYLGESSLYKRTTNRQAMITAEFDKVQTVAALWPRLFGQGLSFQDFKHAYATVLSRVFSVDNAIALVPVLDIANHNPPLAGKLVYDESTKFAVVKATREYSAGDEVFISYGDLSNADLALDFGFVVPNNPFDEVEIFTQIPKTHPLQKVKTDVIAQFGENSYLVREIKTGSVPRQILATVLHIGASSDPELKKLVEKYGGKNITVGAKLLLSSFIDPQMRRLESAIRALDENLPSSYRKNMALHVLFGELQLLHSTKAWLDHPDLM